MTLTIGCIGCGNMGGAMLSGLARHGGYDLCGYNRSPERMQPLEQQGVHVLKSPLAVAQAADLVLVAVKPYQVEAVLREVRPALNRDKVVVSIAAGIRRQRLAAFTDNACPVVRCMPNTPALVGKGLFALCLEDPTLTAAHKQVVRDVFAVLGLCIDMPESKFTAFSALIGAGPAYVFAMMQGLAQAGVTLGFQHAEAHAMVAALFDGCAAMAASGTKHFMQLRDDVCSPAGLTIAGVNVLDRAGLTGLLVSAVLAADARGRDMEKE
ncbi:MAG: pyrroline-5-carboxylate reductase [Desulfovibrio sp.]|nr:pyrroline-5-carboxylate reductase [Desulfovibrio sp.]